jgi:PAS domain S-box-containing protein
MLPLVNSGTVIPSANVPNPDLFPDREVFYRTALESLSEGVMVLDEDCRIIYSNRQVSEITGYSPDELLGQTPGLLKADPNASPCPASEEPGDGPKHFELEVKRKEGGSHWIHVKASPYRNEAGAVVGRVVALSCIARQKNLEFENEFRKYHRPEPGFKEDPVPNCHGRADGRQRHHPGRVRDREGTGGAGHS